MAYLYFVFSSTPNRMGRFIRSATRCPYNHVSLSLDPSLDRMYSFARRHYRTPFYGGFVRESRSRYFIGKKAAQICICRLPVSAEDLESLSLRLEEMEKHNQQYLYNHISAVTGYFKKSYPAKDAYTCVDFASKVLGQLGYLASSKQQSVGSLHRLLKPFATYTGPMFPPQQQDEAYFSQKPLAHPFRTSVRQVARLIPRHRQLRKHKSSKYRRSSRYR